MQKNLSVTLVQTSLLWEDIKGNLQMLNRKLENIAATDLIVLPEMFSTGFSMNTALAETMQGSAIAWMHSIANEKNCIVVGSLMIKEEQQYFNRLIWMRQDGSYEYYDKRHLFSLSQEPKYFTSGTRQVVTEVKGWRFLLLICYDLRFPVWSRNIFNYHTLLYVANWPQKRATAWKSLLQARAIENQCFVIGLNRVGNDGNGMYHSGDSAVIDAEGNYLYQKTVLEDVATIQLNSSALTETRKKFPFLNEKDFFTIKP